ncbi:MAG: hypothetical protein KGN84_05240 [Acidobacteriota bacterium]|nr:hypothetical protein [Acidobacteriota bacterium]
MRLFRVALVISAALAYAADKPAEKTSAQATILDHNEYPCENCFFGVSHYYFCFDAGSKVLVGRDDVRTNIGKKNPVPFLERGKTVPIRYNEKYIWVPGPKGKDIRLEQDYTKKIFLQSDKCQAAIK